MIEVKNLTKKYGNHIAVNDLSFSAKEGQIFGFLGPNGAGKSTTMNMLTGYLAPSSGQIVVNGHDILKETELAKQNIGYLPELPPVYDSMTVEEYLNFTYKLKKLEKKDRKEHIEEIIERIHLQDVRKRLIQNLSKGYKQRVGLAQAIMGYPPIIILDEPTVGLDPAQIIEIRQLIKDLGREHLVILSSHILTEISEVCDHIMIISHGHMVQSGTLEELNELMNGQTTLSLICHCDKDALSGAISNCIDSLPFSVDISVTSKDSDFSEAILTYEHGKELRDELFATLAKEKLAIYEMKVDQKSLEDMFLELTSKEPEDSEALEKADSDTPNNDDTVASESDQSENEDEASEQSPEEAEATDLSKSKDEASNQSKDQEKVDSKSTDQSKDQGKVDSKSTDQSKDQKEKSEEASC